MEFITDSIFIIWLYFIFRLAGRDFFHPAFLLTLIWFFGILACDFSGYFYSPTDVSRLIILFFVFLSSGFGLTSKIFFNHLSKTSKTKINDNKIVVARLNILIVFSIFMCLLYVSSYVTQFANFDNIAEFFYYARVADLNGEPLVNTGWFVGQAPALAFITSLFVVVEIFKQKFTISHYLLGTLLFLTAISLSITGTRSTLVIFLLSVFFLIVSVKRPSVKKICILLIIFFVTYSVSTYFMRSSEADKQSLSLIEIVLNNFVLYIFGGIKGFDIFLNNKININHAQIANILNVKVTESMVFTKLGPNLEGNVFSAFSVYVYYFGWIGTIVFLSVIFTITGMLYELKDKNEFLLISSCFATSSVVLMVFHDYFFAFSPYVGRALILYLFLYKFKKIKITKLFFHKKIQV